jgi:alpha-tubulin suppressor-like RCC1 family protein
MPNPNTNFKNSDGTDLGNILITKEYLMTVYPQIANQLITPELWVWGSNGSGQLGTNSTISKSTPVTTFAGGANWKQVSGGNGFTAAIKTDGTLWTWGYNDNPFEGNGWLGTNDSAQRNTPVTTFAGGTNWKQVATGSLHTAAIKTDGTLWTWGVNYNGQLGVDGSSSQIPITTFNGGTNWKQVSCGLKHTAAIKTDGTLWSWGYNITGQLGDNTTIDRSTPVQTFLGGNNWKQVACGHWHTAAIKTDGTLWTWGENVRGELGINLYGVSGGRTTPVQTFLGGNNWKQVSCGNGGTAAIKTDGTLWIWGQNAYGQLGINSAGITEGRITPVTTFLGGTNWKQVARGNVGTAAIKTDGTLWVWGYNIVGDLGTNDTNRRCTPVTTFAGGTNWKQVACGDNHTVAIKTSDDLHGI